ncbi:MAG: rRNA maturation RNase YbeY [Limisphaerales bacterium]
MSVTALKRLSVEASPKAAVSTITISNRQRLKKIDLRLLKKIVASLLAELKIESANLEINLVGAAEMTLLNETFLQHKGSTDVVTFNYKNSESRIQNPELHGEIFVCVDEAISQAKQFKTNWQSEIVRYIVHGILHLNGYGDLRADLRRKMKREENRLLRQLFRCFALSKL